MCRCAPTLRQLIAEANAKWPDRSKASDGCCASAQHSVQNPTSDHEPDAKGIAHAQDVTHDPAHGVDCHRIVADLVARRDPRIKYVIWDRKITRSYKNTASHPPAWTPQAYTGPNPHTKHCHVSIWTEHENDTAPWFGEDFTMDAEAEAAFAALNGKYDVLAQAMAHLAEQVEIIRHSVAGYATKNVNGKIVRDAEKRSATGRIEIAVTEKD